jgi:hypothetical protein
MYKYLLTKTKVFYKIAVFFQNSKITLYPNKPYVCTKLGLIRFGLERSGTWSIPHGIIWSGLKYDLM